MQVYVPRGVLHGRAQWGCGSVLAAPCVMSRGVSLCGIAWYTPSTLLRDGVLTAMGSCMGGREVRYAATSNLTPCWVCNFTPAFCSWT